MCFVMLSPSGASELVRAAGEASLSSCGSTRATERCKGPDHMDAVCIPPAPPASGKSNAAWGAQQITILVIVIRDTGLI
jgi:hypothetical protein